jgi:hypothetical protein
MEFIINIQYVKPTGTYLYNNESKSFQSRVIEMKLTQFDSRVPTVFTMISQYVQPSVTNQYDNVSVLSKLSQ